MPTHSENPHEYDVTLFWAYDEEYAYSKNDGTVHYTNDEYVTVIKMYDMTLNRCIELNYRVKSKQDEINAGEYRKNVIA